MDDAQAPTTADVLNSLGAAADAARQAYMAAAAANPGVDLSQLYAKEMAAAALWSDAEVKALTNDPAVAAAQQQLDEATTSVRNQLNDMKNLTAALNLVSNLVDLATTVAGFFA